MITFKIEYHFLDMSIKRITKDALLLAILSVIGMLSIPLGDNIKVSLQFLILLIIYGISDHLIDKIIIPTLYLLLGLVAPIYAGFMEGITPTFGYVIAFIFAGIPFHFIYKYLKLNYYIRFILAAIAALLIIYLTGTIFMMLYLHISLGTTLLVSVVPYIVFDIFKIIIAMIVIKLLPNNVKSY